MSLKGAVISDVVGSSSLSDVGRQDLGRHLAKCFRSFNEEFQGVLSGDFVYSVGDEFEAVFDPPHAAIRPMLLFHGWLASQAGEETIRIRSAIGVGRISVSSSRESNLQDGPAFHVARKLIGRMHDGGQSIGITCHGSGPLVYLANSSLKMGCQSLNIIVDSWTRPQWEVVYWKLRGRQSVEIATRLGIAPQNISKRLKNARFELFTATILEIESILRDPDLAAALRATAIPTNRDASK